MYAPLCLLSLLHEYTICRIEANIYDKASLPLPPYSCHMCISVIGLLYPCLSIHKNTYIFVYIYTYSRTSWSCHSTFWFLWFFHVKMQISMWSDVHTPPSLFIFHMSISVVRPPYPVLSVHKYTYVSFYIYTYVRTSLSDQLPRWIFYISQIDEDIHAVRLSYPSFVHMSHEHFCDKTFMPLPLCS